MEREHGTRRVTLNLRQNAYDFIAESLRYAGLAVDDPGKWKFSIICAAQGIELLLKARLAVEHPILVQEDPGKPPPGRTVTVAAAIKRLRASGVVLSDEEVDRLLRAGRLRNEFVHYEVNVEVGQLRDAFGDLFEFAHFFHHEELGEELHDHLTRDLHPTEAAVFEQFRRNPIYLGQEVPRTYPTEVVEAQLIPRFRIGAKSYDRILCDDEDDLFGRRERPCGDCSVQPGQFHVLGCDIERCPRCHNQLLSCECDFDFEYLDDGDGPTFTKPDLD